MRSRGRLAFRPGLATALGVDCLEPRQLLSAAGHVSNGAEVGRAAARAADTANPAGEGEGTVARAEPGASSAAVAATSGGDASPGDSTDGGSGVATIQQVVAAASAGPAARQPTSVDPTPGDEGVAGAVAESPMIEPSGGGGAAIVAAAAPVVAGGAVPVALSAGSASGAAPAPASAPGGARGSGAGDASLIGEIGPDRSLLAGVDSTTSPIATTLGRSVSAPGPDHPGG